MQKVKLPDVYESEIKAIIDVGCYVSESEVIQDALKILFELRPNLKIAAAIEMYKKEEVVLIIKEMEEKDNLKIVSKEEIFMNGRKD